MEMEDTGVSIDEMVHSTVDNLFTTTVISPSLLYSDNSRNPPPRNREAGKDAVVMAVVVTMADVMVMAVTMEHVAGGGNGAMAAVTVM